jgi:hypothetical protein
VVRTVALVTLAVFLVAPTASAHDSDTWYWSTSTARQVLERFVDACAPGPDCSRGQSANARRIGLELTTVTGQGGEVIMQARCSGRGKHVRSDDGRYIPLFKHHVCRLWIERFWPTSRSRQMWVYLHVLGPSNLRNPDAPHHFLLERLP